MHGVGKFKKIPNKKADHVTPNFQRLSSTNFTKSILEYLDPDINQDCRQ